MMPGRLSQRDAAELLGVAESTLAVWRSKNRGPAYYKVGRSITYKLTDIEEWIESSCRKEPGKHEPEKTKRSVVVSDLHRQSGSGVKVHRFGGKKTRSDRCEEAG
jgi:predicted DNA-binding transcriptional regulator AlpA